MAQVQEKLHLAAAPANTGGNLVSMEEHPAWPALSNIPVLLSVQIPVNGLKVRDLLALRCGQTVPTQWPTTEDVPLKAGSVEISWGEFEVVEQRMGLRLTRLK